MFLEFEWFECEASKGSDRLDLRTCTYPRCVHDNMSLRLTSAFTCSVIDGYVWKEK
jgi:hypothetical protein